jgi:CO/xanthine dehydrogenase Mo-binding subunit
MVFGHVLRSPHAHARIRSIDTTAAKAAPGVLAVLTGADWEASGWRDLPSAAGNRRRDGSPAYRPRYRALVKDRVRQMASTAAWPEAGGAAGTARTGRAGPRRRTACSATRIVAPSDPLPQAGLLVEAIEFDAAEIESRNDPHHFAAIDYRKVAIAPVLHQPQRFDRRLARRDRVGIRCHDLGELRPRRALSLCQHPVNRIPPVKMSNRR